MHSYLRAIGLGKVNTHKRLDSLIKKIIKESINDGNVICTSAFNKEEDAYKAQIKYYFDESFGLALEGLYNLEKKRFRMNHYFPFLDNKSATILGSEVAIGRKIDKEAYSVLCDAFKGISLIFFLTNSIEYLNQKIFKSEFNDNAVRVSAMCTEGTILLPVNKDKYQMQKYKAASVARGRLIELARKGDADAIDNLTLDDLDTYNDIYRRMRKEDIFTIVDSSFMPSGLECEVYTIVGNILDIKVTNNSYTKEMVYVFLLECNEMIITLSVNAQDLYGEPEIGRRFRGKVWLQGSVVFAER